MEWKVFTRDMNADKIKEYNVLSHYSFMSSLAKLVHNRISKEAFSEEVKKIAQYYFWSKHEWEVVITSWPPYIDANERNRLNAEYVVMSKKYGHDPHVLDVRLSVGSKIDVFDQLRLNWDAFIDYIWQRKQIIKDWSKT